MASTVIMVHGAFCGGWTFERLRMPFEAGFKVLTPDLPGHADGQSGSAVTGLSMSDYAREIARLCAEQDEPPILVGHSMGGLVAQLAARRCDLKALVLLAPSPPWGVAAGTIEEAVTAFGLHMLGPFWFQAVSPDQGLARAYSFDRLPKPERDACVARLRPESGRALFETLNWWLDPLMTTSLGPGPLKVPSLVLAGSRDVVHSSGTVRQTAERIGGTFLEMPGMSHWLPGEQGWENVARASLEWLSGL
ncbi:alpha/beta fold hydrolase [Phenylobacterium sp.]|uniref:alpha/beta fold hydrolase n=1 Tax=Phenylobacterium sp. TaxID=1871053 RepID=UPI0035B28D96